MFAGWPLPTFFQKKGVHLFGSVRLIRGIEYNNLNHVIGIMKIMTSKK